MSTKFLTTSPSNPKELMETFFSLPMTPSLKAWIDMKNCKLTSMPNLIGNCLGGYTTSLFGFWFFLMWCFCLHLEVVLKSFEV
jgi:hypothetical protein